jgi:hypothetical protein
VPTSAAPFQLLVLGPFGREDVICTMSRERMMQNSETNDLVERAWDQRLSMARERGQSLFPGPMCAFRGWSVEGGRLQIEFGLTDYREFVGTNVSNPEIANRYSEAFLANGTGVCSVLVTSDNQIVLQRRSQSVFEHPGMLHLCGGSLAPIEVDDSLRADPFDVMAIEFEEELGIPATAIDEMICLGIARDSHSMKPDILLRSNVSLPASTILGRIGDEHSDLIAIPNDPAALHTWIGGHWAEIAPAGLACLVAHISCMFATGVAESWSS